MVGGEEGVIVEIILGRPLFAKFLTVSKEIRNINYNIMHLFFSYFHAHIFPGESSLFDVDLLESNGEQVHRELPRHGCASQSHYPARFGHFVSIRQILYAKFL